MNDGTHDQVKVSFPANPTFNRIGRVAVAGLALRLGIEIDTVERLRLAVDQAVSALHGAGRISLQARWEPNQLIISVDNPDHLIDEEEGADVTESLAAMVDEVHVGDSSIDITVSDGTISGVDTGELV